MNNQIRHRSPKTQNNFFNNYYLKSPPKKDINIINFNNNLGVKPFYNQFDYNYNNPNNYNYYDEITKAFNFITFILKQKDSQIKDLKTKIKELERQLNDINETNIMTFNNKDIREIYSGDEKNNTTNANNKKVQLKRIKYNYIPNKPSVIISPTIKKNNDNNNENSSNNNSIQNSTKIFNNNINIINRIKNSTNINKINIGIILI